AIVGIGRMAIPVEDGEIAALQTAVQSGIPAEPHKFLQIGQRVRIVDGALAGVEGVLVNSKGYDRFVLSVSLLQRSVALEIDRTSVEPVAECPSEVPVVELPRARRRCMHALLPGLLLTAVSLVAQPLRDSPKPGEAGSSGYVLGAGDQVTL